MPDPGLDYIPMGLWGDEFRDAGGITIQDVLGQQEEEAARRQQAYDAGMADVAQRRQAEEEQARQAQYEAASAQFVDWPTYLNSAVGDTAKNANEAYKDYVLQALPFHLQRMGYSPEQIREVQQGFIKDVPQPEVDYGPLGNIYHEYTSGVSSGTRALGVTGKGIAGDVEGVAKSTVEQAAEQPTGSRLEFDRLRRGQPEYMEGFRVEEPPSYLEEQYQAAKDYLSAAVQKPGGAFLESVYQFGQSFPVMAAGLLALVPSAGSATIPATGAASFTLDTGAEFMGNIIDEAQKQGVDLNDAAAISAMLRQPDVYKRLSQQATRHGAGVAAFDAATSAVTLGIGGAVLKSLRAGRPLRATGLTLGGIGAGAAMGGLGEAAGEKLAGKPLDPYDIAAEAMGGAFTDVAFEGIGALREAQRNRFLREQPPGDDFPTLTDEGDGGEGDLAGFGGGGPGSGPGGGGGGGPPNVFRTGRPPAVFQRRGLPGYDVSDVVSEEIDIDAGIPTYGVTEEIDIGTPVPGFGVEELPAEEITIRSPARMVQDAERALAASAVAEFPPLDIRDPGAVSQWLADRGVRMQSKEQMDAVANVLAAPAGQKQAAIADSIEGLSMSRESNAQALTEALLAMSRILPKDPVTKIDLGMPVEAVQGIVSSALAKEIQKAIEGGITDGNESVTTERPTASRSEDTSADFLIDPLITHGKRALAPGESLPDLGLGSLLGQLGGVGSGQAAGGAPTAQKKSGGGLRTRLAPEGAPVRGLARGTSAPAAGGQGSNRVVPDNTGGAPRNRGLKKGDGGNMMQPLGTVPFHMRSRGAANLASMEGELKKLPRLYSRYLDAVRSLVAKSKRMHEVIYELDRAVAMQWNLSEEEPLAFRAGDNPVFVTNLSDAAAISAQLKEQVAPIDAQIEAIAAQYLQQKERLESGNMPQATKRTKSGGEELSDVAAAPGTNQERLTPILGLQMYGDLKDIGPVAIKELAQNAFDAIKGAIEEGQRTEGNISVNLNRRDRTITVTDDGHGMTPQVINEAFLTLAGTHKRTKQPSGSFGVAKMLFIYGNKSIKLVTVSDGIESTLETTGEALRTAANNPTDKSVAPRITRKRTDAPNGTSITITMPDEYYDSETHDTKEVPFPYNYQAKEILSDSPLFANIGVTLNGEEMPVGKNFPLDAYTVLNVIKFPWGDVRVLVAPAAADDNSWSNVSYLSNGIIQFKGHIPKNPFDPYAGAAPYRFVFNIEPKVLATAHNYPFALNRQGLSPAAKNDFKSLTDYLGVMYSNTMTEEEAKSFGVLSQFSVDGLTERAIDLNVPDAQEGTTFKIDKNDKVEIHDGRMYVNNRVVPELTKEQMQLVVRNPMQFQVDEDLLNEDQLIIHDNVLLNDKPYLEQVRAKFGTAAVNDYLLSFGRVLKYLRDEAVKAGGPEYDRVVEIPVGVSVDIKYHGVNTVIPFEAMMINPTTNRGAFDAFDIANGIVGTMIHEIAHHTQRDHSETGFIPELQRMIMMMWQTGAAPKAVAVLENTFNKHRPIYEYFAQEFKSGHLKNRGIRLEDGGNQGVGSAGVSEGIAQPSLGRGDAGDGTNLRQGTGARNRNGTAGQQRAGAPGNPQRTLNRLRPEGEVVDNISTLSEDVPVLSTAVPTPKKGTTNKLKKTPPVPPAIPNPVRVPSTALAGAKGGTRTHIAYRKSKENPDSLYTLYTITPEYPRGDPATKSAGLTRAHAEELIRGAGSEVIPPATDTIPSGVAPTKTERRLVGYDGQDLKAAAYQQKDGTWTYYESTSDVHTDPDAKVYKGLSKDQAERYIAARGYSTVPPKSGTVKPSADKPTAVGYEPVSNFRYDMQDTLAPVKAIGLGQRKAGVLPSQDVGVTATLRNTRVQNALQLATEKYVEPVKKIGLAIIENFGVTQAKIESTTQALHIIERANKKIYQTQRGSDSAAVQQKRINKYMADRKAAEDQLAAERNANPNYVKAVEQQFAPRLRAMTNATTDLAAQYGRYTREVAELIKGAYDYYVPLQYGEKTTTGKIATGMNTKTDRSFARIVEQLHRTINQGETNRIVAAVGRLIDTQGVINTKAGANGEPVGTVGEGTHVTYDAETGSLNETVDSHTFDPNTTFYYEKGMRVPLTIANDPVLLKALSPYKGADRDGAIATLMAISSWLNRIVAVGKTSFNLAFPFGNVQRDIQSANVNMPPGVSHLRFNMAIADPFTIGEVTKNVLLEIAGQKPTGLYRQAKEDGAFISHRDYVGLAQATNDLESHFKPSQTARGWNALRKHSQTKLFEGISVVAQISESIPRFAMYKAALDSYMLGKANTEVNRREARLFAANAAKNASVNFEQRGANNLSSWWIFGNAKVQGITALSQSLQRMGVTKSAALLAGITLLGYLVGNAQQDGEKDKDGKPKSVKVPDQQKDSKVFLNEGGFGMTLSQEISPFYVIGHALSEYFRGNTDGAHTASRMFTSIVNNAWPGNVPQTEVAGHKADPWNFLLQSLLPSSLVPIAQIANKKNVFGTEIVPDMERKLEQGIPKSEMGSVNENQLAVNVAKGLNKATGGAIDVAPQQLKLLHNYFDPITETYAFVRDLAGLREPKYQGDVVNPITRRLTANATTFYDQEQFDELLARAARAKFRAEGKPGVARGEGIENLSPEDQVLARSASMLTKIKSDISNMFKGSQMMTKQQRDTLNERARERLLEGIRRYNEMRERTLSR